MKQHNVTELHITAMLLRVRQMLKVPESRQQWVPYSLEAGYNAGWSPGTGCDRFRHCPRSSPGRAARMSGREYGTHCCRKYAPDFHIKLPVVCCFFFLLLCCMLLSGYAEEAAASQKTATAAGTESKNTGPNSPVTVTDDAGKTVTVQAPFKRIISLYGAHTENLFSLGLDHEIIGVSKNDHYPEKVKSKQRFSYHDGPEKFLAVKPDLILIRPMIARGYGPLVRQLERNGITVLSFQPNTVEGMLAYWEKLGHLTGKLQQARLMQESFQKSVDWFLKLTRGIKEKKRVYFEAIHSRMKTFTPGSMPVFVLKTAGGVNIAGDAKQVRDTNIAFYGKERLLAKAEKIDVYLAQRGVMNRVTVREILDEPGYRLIKAIKENEVYLVDETLVSRPTMRLLKGIYQVGRILYPDRFDEKAGMIAKNAIRAETGR